MTDSKGKEYVDFDILQKMLGLNDMTLFLSYLKEVFKDLSERSEGDRKKGINKVTFYDYVKLPIFIAEKLFSALDKDDDGSISWLLSSGKRASHCERSIHKRLRRWLLARTFPTSQPPPEDIRWPSYPLRRPFRLLIGATGTRYAKHPKNK